MKKEMLLKHGTVLLVSILVAAACTGCVFGSKFGYFDFSKLEPKDFSSAKVVKTEKAELDGIQTIKLHGTPLKDAENHWVATLLNVENSPDSSLHVFVKSSSTISNDKLPTLNKDGSTLILEGDSDHWDSNLHLGSDHTAMVAVQIPKDYQKELNIEVDACAFNADRLQSEKFSLLLNAGHAKVGALTGKGKIGVNAGQADIDSFTGSGTIDVNAGQANIKKAVIKDDLSLQVSAGQMNCAMASDSKFQFKGVASAGSLKTYFDAKQSGNAADKRLTADVNGGGSYTVTAVVSAGELNLTKA